MEQLVTTQTAPAFRALLEHPAIQALGKAYQTRGEGLYLVGGCIRDAAEGKATFDDLDLCTSARPDTTQEILSALGPTWDAGKEFGTIAVQIGDDKIEVTTYRADRYDPDSRRPQVQFGNSVVDDLARRDLTINALAVCVAPDGGYVAGQLVDAFGGATDMASGVLRTPGDPVRILDEDPLRALRAVRFAATRDNHLAPDLAQAAADIAPRMGLVSIERRTAEARKVFKRGPEATARAMILSRQLGLDTSMFGGLPTDQTAQQALAALPAAAGQDDQLGLLATLDDKAERHMRKATFGNTEINAAMTRARLAVDIGKGLSDLQARRMIRRQSDVEINAAMEIATARGASVQQTKPVREALRHAEAFRASMPINGDDIVAAGLKPGPAIGRALARAEAAFLGDPHIDRARILATALHE